MILVDAGPLVALIHRDDAHHVESVDLARELREPMATTWPAFTEAMYLLGFSQTAQDALWALVERGALRLLDLLPADVRRMRALMRQYRDLPMDLADAALVAVAERTGDHRLFTFDRRHFSVYRMEGKRAFELLPAAE